MGSVKASKADQAMGNNAPRDSSMYGRLGSVGLNDILQLLGMTSRTATVSLRCRDREGKIFVQDGVVLHAIAGDVSGEGALLRLVSWGDGEFSIEDGIGEPVTPTISKNVDAVMLDVLTQLDESKRSGEPVFTPFPPLDQLDLSTLENKVRSSRIKPPVPRGRSRGKLVGALVVAALALGSGAAFMGFQTLGVDAEGFPAIEGQAPSPTGEAPTDSGVADEVLHAASTENEVNTVELLASHGVSLSSPPAMEMTRTAEPEPEAAAAVPATGRLLVVVEPWARIAVDGRAIGETPLPAFELAAGEHEIVLSNPGFVGDIRETVTVEGGQTLSTTYSFRDTGKLRVLVTPWADVYIDGHHVGQTPMDELDVSVGRHTITLRHPSMGEKREVVDIRRDESVALEVEMR